jgi:hypothetical protein
MDKEKLEKLARLFNRSNNQLNFLFELLDNDLKLLFKLENTIRNNFLSYCPSDKVELDKVLCLPEFGKYGDGKDYKSEQV